MSKQVHITALHHWRWWGFVQKPHQLIGVLYSTSMFVCGEEQILEDKSQNLTNNGK